MAKMGKIIQFPRSEPPEVALYGAEATAWADAERRRLGFQMQPIRWEHLEQYSDHDGVVISIFPLQGAEDAMLRIDWLADQLTKYVRLTNYTELRRTYPGLISRFLSNGIALYLANGKDAR